MKYDDARDENVQTHRTKPSPTDENDISLKMEISCGICRQCMIKIDCGTKIGFYDFSFSLKVFSNVQNIVQQTLLNISTLINISLH